MLNTLDCRGMECPGPVLHVRKTLLDVSPASITVLVDNEAARQNVIRLLEYQKYQVTSDKLGDDIRVTGTKGDGVNIPEESSFALPIIERGVRAKKIVVLITSVHMGHGDDGLGDMLMFNFIKTLKELGPDLWRVIFVNSGVSFTAEDSEAVPVLLELAETGIQIMACGACLAFFHLLDKMQVGEVTNMLDIVISMKEADSVVTV